MPFQLNVAFLLLLCLCNVAVRAVPVPVAGDGKPVIFMPRQCRRYTTLLALDGGGLKGIISTQILMAVSDQIKTYLVENQRLLTAINSTFHYDRISDFHIDLADYFDAVAGISAGSWIATYIASKGGGIRKSSARILNQAFIRRRYGYVRPGSLEGLEVFFMEYGSRIYPLAWPVGIGRPRFWPLPWKLPALKLSYMTVPAHPVAGLEWTLDQFLGDTKLSEVSTSLLVVAFDLNTRSALQFVYDKIEPMVYNLRRVYLYHAIREMEGATERLDSLSGTYAGKCTPEALSMLQKERIGMREYMNVTDVFQGTGKWRPSARPKVVPTTILGQIRNFVVRRNTKEWTDYLNPGMSFTKGPDFYLKDVTRASSAFPILHEAKAVIPIQNNGTVDMIIDGAMVGNNPTMQAWIWLMRKKFVSIRDVATLSIGTGTVKQRLDGLARAGALQWSAALTPILLDDSSEFQQSTLNALFFSVIFRARLKKNQSLRIQVRREGGTHEGTLLQFADSPTSMNALRTMGRETASEYHWNIKGFVKGFIFTGCTKGARYRSEAQRLSGEFRTPFVTAKKAYLKSLRSAKATICPKA